MEVIDLEKLEVLISTIEQTDFKLLSSMNLTSKNIIINQNNKVDEKIDHFRNSTMYTFNEKGVGLSRNLALYHSKAPILLFADDDVKYYDNFSEKIIDAYTKLKDADVIIFDINLVNSNKNGNFRHINKIKKLNKFNAMRFGACRISVRNESIKRARISFSTLFGGGSRYSAGEDSLFLIDCFNKGLNIYQYPVVIGEVDDSSSTWYTGINEKLIKDRGILYYVGFPKIYSILYIYYAFKLNKKTKEYSFFKILKLFYLGKKEYVNYETNNKTK